MPKQQKNVGDDVVFLKLLEAAEHAYKHLDTYGTVGVLTPTGVVTDGHEREIESQKKAFDLLVPAIANARKLFGDD
jgi:hypothetical protein